MIPAFLRRFPPLWPLALALGGLALVVGVGNRGAAETPSPADGGFEEPGDTGFPRGWVPANWGPEGSGTDVWWTGEVSREGRRGLRLESLDDRARPGVTGTAAVTPGFYELRFYARAQEGSTGRMKGAVGGRWSAPVLVGQEWTPVVAYGHAVDSALEIAVQSCGPRGVVFVDSVSLVPATSPHRVFAPDRRPSGERPRLLYLSGNPHYFADTAGEWAGRGFAGFSCAHIMPDWADDIGAIRGLLEEVREAVGRCAAAGLTDNAVLIGLHTPLPDPPDDAGCARLVHGFSQAARFSREAGFRLLLIDTEYAAARFDSEWPGYHTGRPAAGPAAQIRRRWAEVGRAIATEAPELDVAVTPEGVLYYGPLWVELLAGLLEGLKSGGTQGRVHVFCQGTYLLVEPAAIAEHAEAVRGALAGALTGDAGVQWRARGQIALGAWPLGHYRALRDPGGAITGWSGRRETFGDRPVGAFADKTANYPPEQFRAQLAALRSCSDTYCFVYGHGSSWWQVTEEQAREYASRLCPFPAANYTLPAAPNVARYYGVTARAETLGAAADSRTAPAPGLQEPDPTDASGGPP